MKKCSEISSSNQLKVKLNNLKTWLIGKKSQLALFSNPQTTCFLNRWVGFQKVCCHIQDGYGEMLTFVIRWVGGVEKGQKHVDVMYGWALSMQ